MRHFTECSRCPCMRFSPPTTKYGFGLSQTFMPKSEHLLKKWPFNYYLTAGSNYHKIYNPFTISPSYTMIDQQTLIPFRSASISQVTRAKINLLLQLVNSMRAKKTMSLTCSCHITLPTMRDVLGQPLNITTAWVGLWTSFLLCLMKYEKKICNEILHETINQSGEWMRQIRSKWFEVKSSICEWWATTADDSPLFENDDDFDDDIIGMEITFVALADEDTIMPSEEMQSSDEYLQ